jgi:diguanylate cyclase (GGDEF)-like protein
MTSTPPAARRDPRRVVPLHVLALAGAAGLIWFGRGADHWRLIPLAIIASLATLSDLTAVDLGDVRQKISGCNHGIMVAAVLLGGGPAAAVGAATILLGWFKWREAPHYLRNNLVVFICFPLISGRLFHLAASAIGAGPRSVAFYLLVFASFLLSLVLNFVLISAYQSYLDGVSVMQRLRETLLPLLSAELFSALLTMATAYVTVVLGNVGLLLFGLVLLVFQYLVGELLKSKQRSEALHRMATRDELTGLPNRESFRQRLMSEITTAGESGETFAVMLMDLDHFKEINDTLGHHFGDLLLRQLGPRLAEQVGADGLVSRLGGDEFAIIPAERTADPVRLEAAAQGVLSCLQTPFAVDELSLNVGASIGIARFPQDGEDASTLLRRADAAMYDAKAKQTECELYTAQHEKGASQRLTVLSDFNRGLASGELAVHFQPLVNLEQMELREVEALVRWKHPRHGLLQPGAFVETIERTNLIDLMTRQVLERSLIQCAIWREHNPSLTVAVNLSVRNLLDRRLPRDIERLLDEHHLPAEALKLEVTESMLATDPERVRRTLTELSYIGTRISLDDFGTGWSSLANLRDLPINEVKIDRSFVTPMLQDDSFGIIVRSTINLAHDLGLRTVAEGVEDQPTLELLQTLGCDLAQGFHLSRPLPAADLNSMVCHEGEIVVESPNAPVVGPSGD